MSQPNDPTEALPTHRVPADGATMRLDPHRPAPPPDEQTVHLSAGESTVHLAAGESTVHLAAGESTVHLAGEQATTRFAADGATVHLGGGETVDLRRGVPPVGTGTDDPTAYLRTEAPTTGHRTDGATYRTGGYPTRYPTPPEPTAAHRGRTTGAATVPPGRTGSGAVGNAAGEVRFGPGVPTTPPPAPAWPTPAPPARRRPVWRTATSVLSGLLTVALVVVVGLYLWQRLRPLEVDGVTVATPAPAGCDATVDVVATVTTNGRAGEIRYQWLRTGSAPGTLLTERVGRGQRTVALTLRWAFSGVGSTTETATVNIVSPSPLQAQAPVAYDCRR
ncbi:hypothetical protein [Micromonospora sp. NPDC049497]|uniref:hypothetical protein n=1 Tax=Micromonospora sp. NPDC049497 TaxID=3364273 RepID=UPI0037A6D2E4